MFIETLYSKSWQENTPLMNEGAGGAEAAKPLFYLLYFGTGAYSASTKTRPNTPGPTWVLIVAPTDMTSSSRQAMPA